MSNQQENPQDKNQDRNQDKKNKTEMKLTKLWALIERASSNAEIKIENGEIVIVEPQPQDITERIKSFDDAIDWCCENGHTDLVKQYEEFEYYCIKCKGYSLSAPDVGAYLRLRIITCALNEGWTPAHTEGEERWSVVYNYIGKRLRCLLFSTCITPSSNMLFKSNTLAEYAAEQFRDIYTDFFGIKKGGEE